MGEPVRRLCTICARGGSKGVPSKNIRDLRGKPLIAHSILQAKESGLFQNIAVSSDSRDILDIAKRWGADILVERPAALATDEAAKLPVIQHCAVEAEKKTGMAFDTIVDLDATAPLRTAGDIQGAVRLLEESKAPNVTTGMPARRSPYFNLVEVDEKGCVSLSKRPEKPVERRQDAPRCFDMNASIYVWKRPALLGSKSILLPETLLYVMPEERSVDIDSELDFEIVSYLKEKKERP